MADLTLDASRSRVRLQTFAEGLLARLAHDLELLAGDLSGTATYESEGVRTTGSASIEARIGGITVAGVIGKDGRVDAHVLSAHEQGDVLAKMQHEVFHAEGRGGAVVRIAATHDGSTTRVRVTAPNGKTGTAELRPVVEQKGDDIHATGTFELSLSDLGSDAVKGPMGAFRVKDRVKVSFDVWFAHVPRVE